MGAMSKDMGNTSIRLGVGSREGAKSGVWRIWAGKGKSDVYLAVRSYAGIFKVSLHESGRCSVAFTSQFAERNPSALAGRGGSRYFDKWRRKLQKPIAI